MNEYVAFGIFGVISNLAAAFADVPLNKPGKPTGDDKISLTGVQPWWAEVPDKRFKVSFWLSFLGQPGAYVVLWLLADLIADNNTALAMALKINTFISCYTGLLSHLYFCLRRETAERAVPFKEEERGEGNRQQVEREAQDDRAVERETPART